MAGNFKTHFYNIFSVQQSHDKGFPGGSVVKNLTANEGNTGDSGSIPGLGRSPGGKKWQPTPVFLPEKFHEQRILVG